MKQHILATIVFAAACANSGASSVGGNGAPDLAMAGGGGGGGVGGRGGGGSGGGGADMAISAADLAMAPVDLAMAGVDLAMSPAADMATGSSGDGAPMQGACSSKLGNGMTASFGRLDGYVWSVVPESGSSCPNDSTHVHIQVKMNGAVYDLAAPDASDVYMLEEDVALSGTQSWSEGWHTGVAFDYPTQNVHTSDPRWINSSATIRSTLASELAHANHVSIFATGYGSDGGHLIHRQGSKNDGAIIINPLSSPQHVFFFRFQTSANF